MRGRVVETINHKIKALYVLNFLLTANAFGSKQFCEQNRRFFINIYTNIEYYLRESRVPNDRAKNLCANTLMHMLLLLENPDYADFAHRGLIRQVAQHYGNSCDQYVMQESLIFPTNFRIYFIRI
ncbi:MAG: hypothetical protein MHMPM18_000455 [Marteilia pararefringens]